VIEPALHLLEPSRERVLEPFADCSGDFSGLRWLLAPNGRQRDVGYHDTSSHCHDEASSVIDRKDLLQVRITVYKYDSVGLW